MIATLILSIILVTGNGIKITNENLKPYVTGFCRVYGHKPTTFQEKKEVLMNFLSDFLMLKRAKELKLEQDPTFLREWRKAEKTIDSRCLSEKIPEKGCENIKQSVKRVMLIEFLEEKELLPRIKITEEEIETLVENHRGIKKGKTLDRNGAITFLLQKKKFEALQAYVEELMKRYNVKVNWKALESIE